MGIEKGTVHFTSDMHLLEELGERLVASPSVAIAELIKNGFDADATQCRVWQSSDRKTIFVGDDGHGITKSEFLSRWMTVATQNKRENPQSRKYGRVVTGAKGVGRFAARFLGKSLVLRTYSYDEEASAFSTLEATFDWTSFDGGGALTTIDIPYTYELSSKPHKLGTQLEITALRISWDSDAEAQVRREVLDICSPYPSLDHGDQIKREKSDPGFSVVFAAPGQAVKKEADVASEALERYLARLTIESRQKKIHYTITFRDDGEERTFAHPMATDLIGPLHADIRYLPWGKGQFSELENLKGKDVYQWVRQNSGVKIFDHGFKVPPYGDKDDDWLKLSADSASNRRPWRSSIAEALFPRAGLDKDEARDPALALPINHQLLGAAFLNTNQSPKAGDKLAVQRLQVAMDRQGFLSNEGYNQLVDVVRGGLEILAVVCKERDLKKKEQAVREESDRLRKSFRQTIVDVEKSPIPAKEKKKLVTSLRKLEKDVHGLDSAHLKARESIELMGLLGGLAGFMTHETRTLLKTIGQFIHLAEAAPPSLKNDIEPILAKAKQSHQQLDDQLNYAQTFLTGIGQKRMVRLYAHDQAKLVIDKMLSFSKPRGIKPENDIPKKLLSAPTMAVVYGGILMNLYTNAIKAVLLVRTAGPKRIRFEAENTDTMHVLKVSDSGIGIPDPVRDRIFDPLFTTTGDSPLGCVFRPSRPAFRSMPSTRPDHAVHLSERSDAELGVSLA